VKKFEKEDKRMQKAIPIFLMRSNVLYSGKEWMDSDGIVA